MNLCLLSSGLIIILHFISAEQFVGDPCINPPDGSGICTLQPNCSQAGEDIKKFRYHNFTRCGFENRTEILCCPTTTVRAGAVESRRSVKACDRFYKNTSLGIFYQISEGKNALPGEFPYMVALGFYSQQEKAYSFDCGGSLISEKFILTAAHCTIQGPEKKELKIARLGAINVPKSIQTIDNNFDFEIKQIHRHPNYTKKGEINDVAVLELAKSVTFGNDDLNDLRPACLHSVDSLPDEFLITGWGEVNVSEARTNILQKATVRFLDVRKCEQRLNKLSTVSLRNGQICAEDEKSNTCSGDSGGPLQMLESRYPVIVGITSYGGRVCGDNIPTVYTNVKTYLHWIEGIVWPVGT